jgi:hypothetical protein
MVNFICEAILAKIKKIRKPFQSTYFRSKYDENDRGYYIQVTLVEDGKGKRNGRKFKINFLDGINKYPVMTRFGVYTLQELRDQLYNGDFKIISVN